MCLFTNSSARKVSKFSKKYGAGLFMDIGTYKDTPSYSSEDVLYTTGF